MCPCAAQAFRPVEIGGQDLATLCYTSGTTGNPKVRSPDGSAGYTGGFAGLTATYSALV